MMLKTAGEINEYRLRINSENPGCNGFGTTVNLFGVYCDLDKPVIKFTTLSKKFLYEENGEKHHYYNKSVVVFTSQSEAWRFFRRKLKERRTRFESYRDREEVAIDQAQKILTQAFESSPEYFL